MYNGLYFYYIALVCKSRDFFFPWKKISGLEWDLSVGSIPTQVLRFFSKEKNLGTCIQVLYSNDSLMS